MNASVAERIRAGDFTPSELKVARAVLADYPSAGLTSASALGARAAVSAPTVVRFARALGFRGYADFQRSLLAEMSERQVSPVRRLADPAPPDRHWLDNGLQITLGAVDESLRRIPVADLDRAVELLSDPKLQVTVIGGRYTQLIADYLTLHLRQTRRGVISRAEHLVAGTSDVIDAGPRDVFVVYDLRRYQEATVVRAGLLAEAGVRIICITDKWLSPAAQVATVVLPVSVASQGPFDSGAGAFVLSELLVDAVVRRLGPRARERMQLWEAASSHEVRDG